MTDYNPATGRQIISEVLLKLHNENLRDLPLACKTCPGAMWQLTGKPEHPEQLTARCYCKVMHTFTWDSRNKEEILDCDRLYEPEEDEEDAPAPEVEDASLPPFLRQQRERERQVEPTELDH